MTVNNPFDLYSPVRCYQIPSAALHLMYLVTSELGSGAHFTKGDVWKVGEPAMCEIWRCDLVDPKFCPLQQGCLLSGLRVT